MNIIAPLFAALAELYVSGRPLEEVARQFQVNVQELVRAFSAARGNLWKGKFARALQNPDNRPDLITPLSQLASFEHHYQLLMAQWHRAEENCAEARTDPKCDITLKLKVDAFSFRIQQAAAKVLRDLFKAEESLKKTIANPYMTFPAEKAEELHRRRPAHQAEIPAAAAVTQTSDSQSMPSISQSDLPITETAPVTSPDPITLPDPSDFRELLYKHRHRLRDTPAKDRPALIRRLIEQEQSKLTRAA